MTVAESKPEPFALIRQSECDLNSTWESFRLMAFKKLVGMGLPARKSEAWRYINQNELYRFEGQVTKNLQLEKSLLDQKDLTTIDVQTKNPSFSYEVYGEKDKLPSQIEAKVISLIDRERDFYDQLGFSLATQIQHITIEKKLDAGSLLRLADSLKNVSSGITFILVKENVVCSLGLLLTSLRANTQNSFISIEVESYGSLSLDLLSSGSEEFVLLSKMKWTLHSNSKLSLVGFYEGSKIARNAIEVDILGENVVVDIKTLSLVKAEKEQHHHLLINHDFPESYSSQLFRNILFDKGTITVDGTVFVKNGAIGTKSDQLINTLFLSDDATLKVKPNLHILNDDVKCSHGNTSGALDEKSLFYLKSRGLDDESAQGLLTKGFANEILNSFKNGFVKQYYNSVYGK